MRDLVIATQNEGKAKEIKDILAGLEGIRVVGAREIGIFEGAEEDGSTLEENAGAKASFVAKRTKGWVAADDSGIFVEYLDGLPGVRSGRLGGPGVSDEDRAIIILGMLSPPSPKRKRTAWFETVVSLVDGRTRSTFIFRGRVEGTISYSLKGVYRPGLPYDRIFIPDGYYQTFAEMSAKEKNLLSHRGQAFRDLKIFLKANALEALSAQAG